MKILITVCCIVLSLFSLGEARGQEASSGKVFVLLRHAEKEKSSEADPALTAAGRQQAEALAGLLKEQLVAEIYSTNYQRTRDTVTPLAKQKEKTIQIYDATQPEAFVKRLLEHKGEKGAIVIVGHSNTIPELVNRLVGREAAAEMSEADYGQVFVISVPAKAEAKATLITLRLPEINQAAGQ